MKEIVFFFTLEQRYDCALLCLPVLLKEKIHHRIAIDQVTLFMWSYIFLTTTLVGLDFSP